MRKTFPLEVPGKQPPRVIDSIKHEVRKYLKRERSKDLPEDADYWDFACQVGPDRDNPKPVHVAELAHAIDAGVQEQWSTVYIEILAKPGHRKRRDPGSAPSP